jgi:hypothetical protein
MPFPFLNCIKAINLHKNVWFVSIYLLSEFRTHENEHAFFSMLRFVRITNCLWHKCSMCHSKPSETVFVSSSIDWWSRNKLPSANVTVPVRKWLPQWANLLCWHMPNYLQIVSNILYYDFVFQSRILKCLLFLRYHSSCYWVINTIIYFSLLQYRTRVYWNNWELYI